MGKFRNKYKNHWRISNEREKSVRRLLSKFGYELEPFGFMAESDEYFDPKKHKTGNNFEQGRPDYKIVGTNKLVEVTGTDSQVSPMADLWVRPDKVTYAKNHPEYKVILIHVLDHMYLYRWMYMLDCGAYRIETRLTDEKFHIIPCTAAKFLK